MKNPEPKFSRLAEELIAAFRELPADRTRAKRRPTRPIGSAIEAVLAEYRIGQASPEQALRDRWPEVVGPANAAYCHVVRVDRSNRVLVAVSHAVVRNELFLHKEILLARMREVPGCEGIRQIVLRAG